MIPCSCAASSASAICFAIGKRFIDRDDALRDPLREIVTLDEFHHERTYTARLFEAVDVRDVRMVQRGERLRFAREPRESIGIARE